MSNEHYDPDLQAGSLGLSMQEIVARYLKTPGQVLTLLHTMKQVGYCDEAGEVLQHIAALAKFFEP
jgi:hypothetical protein